MAIAAPVMLILACLGAGAALLAAFNMLNGRPYTEKIALSFAVGFGFVGWLFFWLGVVGWFSPAIAWIAVTLLAGGIFMLSWRPDPAHISTPFSRWEWLLLGLIGLALAGGFLEALAPPVEADTLAYHFQLAKQFVEAGRLVFVPRALDGAIPLLIHMTYVAALLLGGNEQTALTMWTFVSGWAAGLLLFAFSRRWLARHWGLALLLLFQTLPAMLYSAGSGQVEPRLAMFVLVAAFGLVEFRDNPRFGPILLIGLGAGLFAASKYTGLLFVAAAGLSLLIFSGRNWLKNGVVCGLAVLVAGAQWYGWNAYNTGDPVFPVLFTVLDLKGGAFWNADYAASMKSYLALRYGQIEWWQRWLAYPIVATLSPPAAMEAGRVGLGPYFLMVAPFALAGAWFRRRVIKTSSLAPAALTVILFYVLWLGFGGIPKVRHLIPILPVVLVLLAVGSAKAIEAWSWLRRPAGLAMVLALAINTAAAGFFFRPYAAYAFNGFDGQAFLLNGVNGYPAVAWLNRQKGIKKVLLTYRAYRYYVRPPSFYAFPGVQKQIEARPGRVKPRVFWRQMRDLGISHILTDRPTSMSSGPASVDAAIRKLAGAGCLVRLKEIETEWRTSRTLPSLGVGRRLFDVWKLDPGSCRLNKAG